MESESYTKILERTIGAWNDKSKVDEYLDLVDENDNVIGKEKRSEAYKKNLNNFRVINCFILNSKGELWIPRRTENKRLFPLCLDVGMGGHVESGETYEQAFSREVKEELNIDTSETPYRLLGYLTPQKDGVHAYMKVFEIKMDEAPNYNRDDFIEYFWLIPKEIIEIISQGEKAKGDLIPLLKIFYSDKL